MSVDINFNGMTTNIPGSYSEAKPEISASGNLSPRGTLALIGEASAGEPCASSGPIEFLASEINTLISVYKTGPIVDAAILAFNPSNDPEIQNGANKVVICKTNDSTAASLDLATGYGTLDSKNYGVNENLIATLIEKNNATNASVSSSATFSSTIAQGKNFGLRVLGGALNSFTNPSSVTTRALLQTALETAGNWSGGVPSGITFTVGGASDGAATLTIALNVDATDHRLGAGRNFELVEGVSNGMLTIFGISAGLKEALVEPTSRLKITRTSTNTDEDTDNVDGDLGGDIVLEIGALATTATLTISATNFTTTCAGGTAQSLNLKLSDYATLNDLAEYIANQAGYYCSIPEDANGGLNPRTVLDRVTAKAIAVTGAVKAGKIKSDSYNISQWIINNSAVVDFTGTSFCGLPDALAKTFLSGGALGSSSNSSFTSALSDIEGLDIDVVVPLVSQDASYDIAEDENLTDSSSTYTVDSVLVAVKNHCKLMSNTENRKERKAYFGYRGTFSDCKKISLTLNSERASLCPLDVYVVDSSGSLQWKQPHMGALMVGAMSLGSSVGTPITNKAINASGIRHLKRQGVTPSTLELINPNTNAKKCISAGLLMLESPAEGGIKCLLQNATYSTDSSFIYNRPSVLDACDYSMKNLRLETKKSVGKKTTLKAADLKTVVIIFLNILIKSEVIVGYKNISITIAGNTAYITGAISPVEGIDFVLNKFALYSTTTSA